MHYLLSIIAFKKQSQIVIDISGLQEIAVCGAKIKNDHSTTSNHLIWRSFLVTSSDFDLNAPLVDIGVILYHVIV